jgi:hypothetical protein
MDKPVVLPENEGKLVILAAPIKLVEPVYDEKYGFTISSPVATRWEQELGTVTEYDRDGDAYETTGWTNTKWAYFFGVATMGEFFLSDSLLTRIAGNQINQGYYSDYIRSEVARSEFDLEGSEKHRYLRNGNRRILYLQFVDLNAKPDYTISGIQKGNNLVLGDDLDVTDIQEGLRTQEQFIKQYAKNVTLGSIFGVVFGSLMVFGGVSMMRKRKVVVND